MNRSGYTFVTVEVKVKKYNKTVNIRSLGILGDLGAVSRDDQNIRDESYSKLSPRTFYRPDSYCSWVSKDAWSLGKPAVSFVFPQVLMIPLTSSREKSGLLGKQNQLFPSGSDIKL